MSEFNVRKHLNKFLDHFDDTKEDICGSSKKIQPGTEKKILLQPVTFRMYFLLKYTLLWTYILVPIHVFTCLHIIYAWINPTLVHDNHIILRFALLQQQFNVVRLKDAGSNWPLFTYSRLNPVTYSFQMDTPAFPAGTWLRPNGQDKERNLHSKDKLVRYERQLKYYCRSFYNRVACMFADGIFNMVHLWRMTILEFYCL